MFDWRDYNSPDDLPDQVLGLAREHTRDRIVIDFGAGQEEGRHVDFEGRRTIRIDESAESASAAERLRAALAAVPLQEEVVVVFFRVLSLLGADELQGLRSVLSHAPSVTRVVVYDYTLDERKAAEYSVERTWLGTLHRPTVEWSSEEFCHYSLENLSAVIPLPHVEDRLLSIPAYRRRDGRGLFAVYASS